MGKRLADLGVFVALREDLLRPWADQENDSTPQTIRGDRRARPRLEIRAGTKICATTDSKKAFADNVKISSQNSSQAMAVKLHPRVGRYSLSRRRRGTPMHKLKTLALAVTLSLGIVPTANAAAILFAQVGSGIYDDDGAELAGFLTDAGHTVTYVDLNTAVIADFSPYSQVWVYDLVTGANSSANQMANYTNIANWYSGLTEQNLIADGRIISSGPDWVAGGEPAWIQNYAAQLDAVGGGLVLGTDHNDYQAGINTINSLIGIDPFSGFFPGPQAVVDPLSPLYIATLSACLADPAQQCINDNSTTGFVPTGLQPNGQFLTPVAYHGTTSTAFANAAVSSTFESQTFPIPEPGTLLLVGGGLAAGIIRRRRRSGRG